VDQLKCLAGLQIDSKLGETARKPKIHDDLLFQDFLPAGFVEFCPFQAKRMPGKRVSRNFFSLLGKWHYFWPMVEVKEKGV